MVNKNPDRDHDPDPNTSELLLWYLATFSSTGYIVLSQLSQVLLNLRGLKSLLVSTAVPTIMAAHSSPFCAALKIL